ncbi:MAG: primosomal protein N' [Lachnospiraceae bacterium]|nr:primosomal protein N' [Lachnospiraceae bacterium]
MQYPYADIIIDISHGAVDRPFQYKIPEDLQDKLFVGQAVQVPFGNGNKTRLGYIIGFSETPQIEPSRIKEILSVPEKEAAVEGHLIQLAYWMKEHYGSTMINAMKTVIPAHKKSKQLEHRSVKRLVSAEDAARYAGAFAGKHQVARARVMEALSEEEVIPYEILLHKLNISAPTVKSLEQQGFIKLSSEKYYRNPLSFQDLEAKNLSLSDEQRAIVEGIRADREKGERHTYLIYGITGSGKTEVYISLIRDVVAQGGQAIVLIPEIALTYQTVMRFYRHFGDRVSVMNSTLSDGEKYDQCERAKKGEIDVIIGPRSALFTPFPNLQLIVIDEEHENSYKSENVPRYHARETAEKLGEITGASLVLGSATPSLESYYRAQEGKYVLYTLNRRLTGGSLPQVHTVDLRTELKEGNRTIFSRKLQELMEDRLEKQEQVMLFLNRRGLAGFVSCRNCGLVVKCPHCDVALTQHRGGRMVCHYCGYEMPEYKNCPQCGSPYIKGWKAGTQQIEDAVVKMFPKARVLRMDADTTTTKDSYEKILTSFANQEADVLVGTQMIVKGHDFPNVTLVGILAADLSLFANDYRCGERTFQLLTQAAGRAGRGTKPGDVVIQTYQPDHYSITYAAKQDYVGFYEEEISYRKLLSYPPASHMLAVIVTSDREEEAKTMVSSLARIAKEEGARLEEEGKKSSPFSSPERMTGYRNRMIVIGPGKASVSRIKDIYRYVFYVKHPAEDALIRVKDLCESAEKNIPVSRCQVYFDFDPMYGY